MKKVKIFNFKVAALLGFMSCSLMAHGIRQQADQSVITLLFGGGLGSKAFCQFDKSPYVNGHLMCSLFKRLLGDEYINFLYVDGLLNKDKSEAERFYRPIYRRPYSFVETSVFHRGIKRDLEHVSLVLQRDLQNPDHPDYPSLHEKLYAARHKTLKTANIVCYSMGCLTAVRLVNQVNKDTTFTHLRFNLVMIDPVAGLLKAKRRSNFRLTPNVDDVVILYATNERSVFFEPFDPYAEDPQITRIVRPNFPGSHMNIVGSPYFDHPTGEEDIQEAIEKARPNMDKLERLGDLVLDQVEVFLKKHGSLLSNCKNFSKRKRLRLYNQMMIDAPIYKQSERTSFTGFKNPRSYRKVRIYKSRFKKFAKLHDVVDHNFKKEPQYVNLEHKKLALRNRSLRNKNL